MSGLNSTKSKLIDLTILIFFCVSVTSVVVFLLGERTPDYAISSQNFADYVRKNQPVIIDLRESNEISKSQLLYQPMIHYPFLNLERDISLLKIDSTHSYLLVCNDGNRSRLISSYLASRGITAHYLQDGLWGVPEKQIERLRKSE
jgi:rhodanese-related sulfurtransferase